MTVVPSTAPSILCCAASGLFRLQKIAQHIREGPLHEHVGGLIVTGVSNEKRAREGAEAGYNEDTQAIDVATSDASLMGTWSSKSCAAYIHERYTASRGRWTTQIVSTRVYLARRMGSLPSSEATHSYQWTDRNWGLSTLMRIRGCVGSPASLIGTGTWVVRGLIIGTFDQGNKGENAKTRWSRFTNPLNTHASTKRIRLTKDAIGERHAKKRRDVLDFRSQR